MGAEAVPVCCGGVAWTLRLCLQAHQGKGGRPDAVPWHDPRSCVLCNLLLSLAQSHPCPFCISIISAILPPEWRPHLCLCHSPAVCLCALGATPARMLTPHAHSLCQVVTIKNKYIILNDTGLSVEFKQKGTPDPGREYGPGARFAGTLPPRARTALHWDNMFSPHQIVIRPEGEDWWVWVASHALHVLTCSRSGQTQLQFTQGCVNLVSSMFVWKKGG